MTEAELAEINTNAGESFVVVAQSREKQWRVRVFGPPMSWDAACALMDEMRPAHPRYYFTCRPVRDASDPAQVLL